MGNYKRITKATIVRSASKIKPLIAMLFAGVIQTIFPSEAPTQTKTITFERDKTFVSGMPRGALKSAGQATPATVDIVDKINVSEIKKVRKSLSSEIKSPAKTQIGDFVFPPVFKGDYVFPLVPDSILKNESLQKQWIQQNIIPIFEKGIRNFPALNDSDKISLLGSLAQASPFLYNLDSVTNYMRQLTELGFGSTNSITVRSWAVMARTQAIEGMYKVSILSSKIQLFIDEKYLTALRQVWESYLQLDDATRISIIMYIISAGENIILESWVPLLPPILLSTSNDPQYVTTFAEDISHIISHFDNLDEYLQGKFMTAIAFIRYRGIYTSDIKFVTHIMKAIRDYRLPAQYHFQIDLIRVPNSEIPSLALKLGGVNFVNELLKIELSQSEREQVAGFLELETAEKNLLVDQNLLVFTFTDSTNGANGNRSFSTKEIGYFSQLKTVMDDSTEELAKAWSAVIGFQRSILSLPDGGTAAFTLGNTIMLPMDVYSMPYDWMITHEIGECVRYFKANSILINKFITISQTNNERSSFITDYAARQWWDDFPETLRFWIIDSEWLICEAIKRKFEGNGTLLRKVLIMAELFAWKGGTNKIYFLTTSNFNLLPRLADVLRDNDDNITSFILPDGTKIDINNPPTPVKDNPPIDSKEFLVHQNYPNPFSNTTNLTFDTPSDGKVQVEVYDMLGQKVASLLNNTLTKGSHKVTWYPPKQALSSGVYFIRVTFIPSNGQKPTQIQTKKVLFMKSGLTNLDSQSSL